MMVLATIMTTMMTMTVTKMMMRIFYFIRKIFSYKLTILLKMLSMPFL